MLSSECDGVCMLLGQTPRCCGDFYGPDCDG